MEWFIQLRGSDVDLQELSKSLKSIELCITKENDMFILKSSAFNQLNGIDEVKEKSEELISWINGAGRIAFRMRNPLVVDAIVKINDDGKRVTTRFVSDTVYGSSSISLTITRNNGTIEEIHPADSIPAWINVSQNDENVAKVFRLLGKGTKDWINLYRMYEVVAHDVGSVNIIVDNGWASNRQIVRFRRTANSVGVVGDLARHGVETTDPPPNPMQLSEAESLIETIIHNWLRSKT